jgi:2-(3-amino-3-carboxypropyl)histidine synthase
LGWRKDRVNSLEIKGYNIDLESAVKKINKNDYKKVVLQVPEGLKLQFKELIEYLEKNTRANIIVSGDPCFGACDIPSFKNIDLIIQIGHLPIPSIKKFKVPVIFLNAESDVDVIEVVEKAIPSLNGKKIGVVTTAQHAHKVKEIEKILVKNGFEPVLSIGDNRIASKGQILGCNFSAATKINDKVDMFLFVGSGTFHPLGLILATKKPVISCDPYTKEVKFKELEDFKDMILRQRYGAIARSKDAKVFGIVVGSKVGQNRLDEALKIKKIVKSKDKKAILLMVNFFSPGFLESFRGFDCFVSLACPRIAIDDYMQYETPIITPVELEIVLGLKKWDDYSFDEILS